MTDISAWGYDEVSAIIHHSPEWHERRRSGVGGSDAAIILRGDRDELIQLWRQKRGEIAPEDLSHSLPVLMGVCTEPLNRYLFQRDSGRTVTHAGESFASKQYPWMRMSVDGLTRSTSGPIALFEAKTVNALTKMDKCIQTYMPQLHHGMIVADVEWAVLSVIVGTWTYEYVEVALDVGYAGELIDCEQVFWDCVENDRMPVGHAPVVAPVPPSEWRTVDMTGNNEWAEHAITIIETEFAIKRNVGAKAGIKELMAPDVGCAYGHGVTAKRSKPSAKAKAGAVTIRIDGNDE